jgi:hypothetical protein
LRIGWHDKKISWMKGNMIAIPNPPINASAVDRIGVLAVVPVVVPVVVPAVADRTVALVGAPTVARPMAHVGARAVDRALPIEAVSPNVLMNDSDEEIHEVAQNRNKRQCPIPQKDNAHDDFENNDDENDEDSNDDSGDFCAPKRKVTKLKKDRVNKSASKRDLRFDGFFSVAKLIPSASELPKQNFSSLHPFQLSDKLKAQQVVGSKVVSILALRPVSSTSSSSSSSSSASSSSSSSSSPTSLTSSSSLSSSSASSSLSSSSSSYKSPVERVPNSNPLTDLSGEDINYHLHALHPQRNINGIYCYVQDDGKNYMTDITQTLNNAKEIYDQITEDNDAFFIIDK